MNYLAAILEQNIDLFEQITRLTTVINKLDINQCDLWEELHNINKTNVDIVNNYIYLNCWLRGHFVAPRTLFSLNSYLHGHWIKKL